MALALDLDLLRIDKFGDEGEGSGVRDAAGGGGGRLSESSCEFEDASGMLSPGKEGWGPGCRLSKEIDHDGGRCAGNKIELMVTASS